MESNQDSMNLALMVFTLWVCQPRRAAVSAVIVISQEVINST